jgi:hypothetical protein
LLGYHRSDGRTAADVWEAQDWEGLNNDERFMMRHRRQARLTVIEVQRIEPPDRIHVLDLFDPSLGRLMIRDAQFITRVVRFSRLFTWITPFPYFCNIPSSAFALPSYLWPGWRAQVQERYDHQKAKRLELSWPGFFLDNFKDSVRLITEQASAFRQQLIQSLDLQACAAIYRPTVPVADLEAVLHSKVDFTVAEPPVQEANQEPPVAFFQWRFQGESADLEKELPSLPISSIEVPKKDVLASVWLYPDRLVIETLSQHKHRLARRMADKYFGTMASFERELTYDLAQMQATHQEAERAVGQASAWLDEEETGPAGGSSSQVSAPGTSSTQLTAQERQAAAENQRRLAEEKHHQYFRQFPDAAQPALDGKTPRAAAKDPGLRPRLVELMKDHLNHVELQNQRDGLALNLDGLLKELELPELQG